MMQVTSTGVALRILLLAGTLLFAPFKVQDALAEEARRPNIVLILMDNLGWGELGVYGGGILRGAPTPRIDAFAAEGLRLLNFNVEFSCSPSRSDLMTGRFAIRSGTLKSAGPKQQFGLVRWEVTIAQLLAQQGYATAHFGKWHLGNEEGRYPNDRGFDEWYGIPRTTHESMNRTSPGYDPEIVEPQYILAGRKGEASRRVKEYTMEARRQIDGELTARTIEFMSAKAAAKQPFFAYVPLTQVHFPTIPSAEFSGRTENGDFADSVVETDHHVGEMLDAIDQLGLADNTIVIVASENGPEYRRPWRGTAGYWRGNYHTALEGGLRAPFMIRWPGKIKPRVSNDIVHIVDMFNTLARAGGARVPTDRPIDGVDQLDFFTGAQPKSPRSGFPIYIEGMLFAIKWNDWKYHLIWRTERTDKPVSDTPYLFNVLVDPKEESPRDDSWVKGPITAVMENMQASLAEYPPIPFGAPNSYVPQKAAGAKASRTK